MRTTKRKTKVTHIRIDNDVFRNNFEPKRLQMSRKYKVNLSQREFMKMLLVNKPRRKNAKAKQKR